MYKKFEDLLKQYGISAYQVSKATGVAGSTMTNWKKGVYKPKVDKLMAIAKFFGVPVEYFLEE